MEEAPALNTRSQAKECKTCDFCLIKKELSKLNQMIMCPTKAVAKKMQDEQVAESKKRKKETKEEKKEETKEETQDIC